MSIQEYLAPKWKIPHPKSGLLFPFCLCIIVANPPGGSVGSGFPNNLLAISAICSGAGHHEGKVCGAAEEAARNKKTENHHTAFRCFSPQFRVLSCLVSHLHGIFERGTREGTWESTGLLKVHIAKRL